MKSIDAVGFDLGETLIIYAGLPLSWEALYNDALTELAQECGCDPTEDELARACDVLAKFNTRLNPRDVEVNSETVVSEILKAWGMDDYADMESAKDALYGFFQETYAVYDDTRPALKRMQALNLKIGVLTDVPYGMDRRFVDRDVSAFVKSIDIVLTSTEVGFRKPNPAGFLSMARALGVDPARMAFVGNESKDMEGANLAGMVSILLDRERQGSEFGQRITIATLDDLDGALAGL